jgi:DNA-binding MarR family transcriptional regulator
MASEFELIAQTCACFHLRRVSRAMTAIYDDALKPLGLRSTQYVALLVIHLKPEAVMSEIASTLSIDRTSFSRLMGPLKRKGLVKAVGGSDRRTQRVSLTPKGETTLRKGVPYWRAVQSKVEQAYSEPGWANMLKSLNKVDALRR